MAALTTAAGALSGYHRARKKGLKGALRGAAKGAVGGAIGGAALGAAHTTKYGRVLGVQKTPVVKWGKLK